MKRYKLSVSIQEIGELKTPLGEAESLSRLVEEIPGETSTNYGMEAYICSEAVRLTRTLFEQIAVSDS